MSNGKTALALLWSAIQIVIVGWVVLTNQTIILEQTLIVLITGIITGVAGPSFLYNAIRGKAKAIAFSSELVYVLLLLYLWGISPFALSFVLKI